MRELKPCPFCGCSEAGTQWHHGYWSVSCGYNHDSTPSIHCFQDWGEFETEEQAIEAWNMRADNIKYGHWISCKNNSGYKCSECGARIKNSALFNGNHKWCHQCGAKMNTNRDMYNKN